MSASPLDQLRATYFEECAELLDSAYAQLNALHEGAGDDETNLVGELVINQSMLVQMGSTLPPEVCPGLIAGLETLSQHLRELQEGVMAIRRRWARSSVP